VNYFTKFIIDNHLGELSSVTGVLIGVIGFIITIWNVVKSRKASQKAEAMVSKVREDISKMETIEEFSKAIATINEIKRLNRDSTWSILPERCSALRRSLISIKTSNQNMPDCDRTIITNAIQHISNIESQIEKVIFDSSIAVDIPKLNKIISQQADKLTEILNGIKSNIGR
jgi:hypothetical protein